MLVAHELVLRPGRHEHRMPLAQLDAFAFNLQDSVPFEYDVDLVVLVRLLAVRLGSDEHVHPHLDPGGGMNDLVAPQALRKPLCHTRDINAWAGTTPVRMPSLQVP